jgi:hypothetical protein
MVRNYLVNAPGLMLKRFPLHPFAFAIFPILGLLAYNIRETYVSVAARPLLISLAVTAALLLLFRLLARDGRKAALAVSLLAGLFFLYGHLYHLLEAPILGVALGRHRTLLPLFGVLFLLGLWLVFRKVRDPLPLTGFLNLVGAVLVIFPLIQLAAYTLRTAGGKPANDPGGSALAAPGDRGKPDIYYIILDSYTRADRLKANFNFDNSAFLDELSSLGFYVAACSRSNYRSTQASLAASLNLDYLPEAITRASEGKDPEEVDELIQQNLVKSRLRALGYQIVAFETGYRWSEWRDADLFLSPSRFASESPTVEPFEALLINTTALRVVADFSASLNRALGRQVLPDFDAGPHQAHVQRQLFMLDQLARIPALPGPKFVFAHLLTTHSPLVFTAQGEISKTPCEFSQELRTEEERQCLQRNYTGSVSFTNQRLLEILHAILEQSSIPPVIILQGDHGVQHVAPYDILNAYYLPQGARQRLYPSISPVNSFRVVFDEIFGAGTPLLPDLSYSKRNYVDAVPESSPACKAPGTK